MTNRIREIFLCVFFLASVLAFHPIMQYSSRMTASDNTGMLFVSSSTQRTKHLVFVNDKREDEVEIVMSDEDTDEEDLPEDVLADLEAGQPSEISVMKEVSCLNSLDWQ